MDTARVHYPHASSYLARLTPTARPGKAPVFGISPIDTATFDAWESVAPLLQVKRSEAPARLEIFAGLSNMTVQDALVPIEGMLLFNSSGNLITHVLSAKLGYDEQGPALSMMILEALDVPSNMIKDINNSARGAKVYHLSVWRDMHGRWWWKQFDIS